MIDKAKSKEQFYEPSGTLQSNIKAVKSKNNCKRIKETKTSLENFYKAIFENIGTATIIIEEDNTISLANEEFEKLTGYARKEVEGKRKWTEVIAQKDILEQMKEYHRWRRIDPQSVPKIYEFQFINQNGQIKDIIINMATMPGMKQSLAVLLDITDRKQTEKALQESEKRLADTIDFLPDATFAIDPFGKVTAWNRAIEKMTGIKAQDMLEKGKHEYAMPFYGMQRPMLIDLVFGFVAEIEKKYDFVRREGDVILAEANVPVRGVHRVLLGKAGPLYDSSGNVTGAIESIRDITDRRQAEKSLQKAHDKLEVMVRERTAELMEVNKVLQLEISERKHAEAVMKESEEKYNQFFKTSRDCVFITSEDGRFIDLNDAAVEFFGYSNREELMRTNVLNFYANPKDREEHTAVITKHGYTKNFNVDFRRKDGEIRHALITSAPRYDADRNLIGLQGTIRDITEQRQIEEEREKLILELQKAMSQVKTLSGLLPICACCKKIRDDKGYWNQIESYIRDRSEAEFSHSICPDCARRLYPEIYEKNKIKRS